MIFSNPTSVTAKIKAMLTKLWPNPWAGRFVDTDASIPQRAAKDIRNHPEEGVTRTVLMSGRDRPVKRQPEQGRMKSVSSSSVSSNISGTRMADVIRLKDRQPRGRTRAMPDTPRTPGTIVLFTGIRYERMDGDGIPGMQSPLGQANVPASAPINGTTNNH